MLRTPPAPFFLFSFTPRLAIALPPHKHLPTQKTDGDMDGSIEVRDKTTGAIKKCRYFTTERGPKYGIFVPAMMVTRKIKPWECLKRVSHVYEKKKKLESLVKQQKTAIDKLEAKVAVYKKQLALVTMMRSNQQSFSSSNVWFCLSFSFVERVECARVWPVTVQCSTRGLRYVGYILFFIHKHTGSTDHSRGLFDRHGIILCSPCHQFSSTRYYSPTCSSHYPFGRHTLSRPCFSHLVKCYALKRNWPLASGIWTRRHTHGGANYKHAYSRIKSCPRPRRPYPTIFTVS